MEINVQTKTRGARIKKSVGYEMKHCKSGQKTKKSHFLKFYFCYAKWLRSGCVPLHQKSKISN